MSLKIYKASAGSGKTYKLTYEYLRLIVINPFSYRKILAVTFTNKATDEMKERILTELFLLSSNKHSDHLETLIAKLKLPEDVIRQNAKQAFNLILHNYSNFSVSTIDSFFQKIFRAFLFELDIKFNFDLLLDDEEVLTEAVKQLLESIEPNEPNTNWLMELINNKIEDGKSYKLENELITLGKEIFKEKFSVYQNELFEKINDKVFLSSYTKNLTKTRNDFINYLKENIKAVLNKINNSGFEESDFIGGTRGLVSYLNKVFKITNNIKFETIYSKSFLTYKELAAGNGNWYSSNSKHKTEVEKFCLTNIKQKLSDIVNHIENNKYDFVSANLILKNLYNLGLLSEIARESKEYTNKNGYFLLSEIPKFLSQIIGNDGASFVYEKTGTRYNHFMIDEFQDTSQLQYKNFLPLIENSLAQGSDNLVVGDVKQSIYRWRNSNWQLLANHLQKDLKRFEPETITLDENYRSKPNIIAFNNSLYSILPDISCDIIEDEIEKNRIKLLYKEHYQNIPKKKFENDGYLKISFIDKNIFTETIHSEWLTNTVFDLWNRGIKDIAVLIRNNKTIPEVFSTLFNYKKSDGTHPCPDFRVISGESLVLTASGAVNFLVSLIKFSINPNDEINKALLVNEYYMYLKKNGENPEIWFNNISNNIQSFKTQEFINTTNLPIYEMVEHFISIFDLYSNKDEIPFILNFLDCIRNFSSKPLANTENFIDWWDKNSSKQLISMNDEKEAVKVVTIHKSKGMQYEAVIIPFPDWAILPSKNKPLLWCTCKNEPFNELPVFPIQYDKNMQYSYFAKDYFEESLLSIVDNINLLYVATTRAKSILQIACPVGKRTETTYIYNLIYDSVFSDVEISINGKKSKLNSFYNKENQTLEIGNIENIIIDKESKDLKKHVLTSTTYNYFNTEILIADNSFGTISKESENKIKFGTLLHEILALIKNKDNVETVIKRFCTLEKISLDEQKQLTEIINALFKIPFVNDWFNSNNKTLTEIAIIEKNGKVYRPDRVIINEDKVIVIDYKTGQEEIQKHKNQITKYMNLIKEMKYNNIEGYLLYTDLMKVEKVNF